MPPCFPEEAQGMIENTDVIIAPLCLALVAKKTRKESVATGFEMFVSGVQKLGQGLRINAQVQNVVKNRSSLSIHHLDVFLAGLQFRAMCSQKSHANGSNCFLALSFESRPYYVTGLVRMSSIVALCNNE